MLLMYVIYIDVLFMNVARVFLLSYLVHVSIKWHIPIASKPECPSLLHSQD